MTKQEDLNGLHVRLVEAKVIQRSDVAGAFRRGAIVTLELDDAQNVNVMRGEGRILIARVKEGAETAAIVRRLQAGDELTGWIEGAQVERGGTVLRIRLDR